MSIALQGKATIVMEIDGEEVTIEVDGNNAPITAGNFVDLVDRGVYDDTRFHRVITEPEPFVAQGGDPQSSDPEFPFQQLGGGGFIDPDTGERRNIPLEITPEGADQPLYNQTGIAPELKHEQGVIAMARSEAPDTASTQFYFTLAQLDFLDGNYAVFGRVVDGFDVIQAIEPFETTDELGQIRDDISQSDYLEQTAQITGVEVTDIDSMLILGTDDAEILQGTSFNDRLDGLKGDDTLNGNNGKDTLIGGGGDDQLQGQNKRDRLVGSTGNDTLNGGSGSDILNGGSGKDSFVLRTDSDRVTDFNSRDDLLVLSLSRTDSELERGRLSEELFHLGSEASNRTQRIIYDPNEGILSYDPDGSGRQSAREIAILIGAPEVSYRDIRIL